jgi:hypothetical protein
MVERGEISQNDARKLVSQLRAKSPRALRKGVQAETVADVSATPPSKADIQQLHNDIAALSAKLDQIKSQPASASAPMSPKVEVSSPVPPKPPVK